MAHRILDAGTLSLPWPSPGERTRKRASADGVVLVVTVILTLIGLVMVFSASAVVAGNRFQDSIYFLKRHVAWLAFGFLVLQIVSRMEYTIWRRLALPILALITVLLIVVLIPSIGVMAKGARRWIKFGPVSMQPAEMVKLATVIYLAAYLTKKEAFVTDFARGFLPPLLVLGVLSGLVLLQPDLGTAVVVALITIGMLFLGGARPVHVLALVPVGALAMAALILHSPYRVQRFMTFLEPAKDPTGAGFQVNQSFLAFGSGGAFGVGLGEGKQKLFFLPEAHTDFVLALVGEELGLAGTAVIMMLFGMLVFKGFQIAARAREPFGRHLALGITMLIAVQALINTGVATGMLPTKGLTLPLVSYGGSSLLVTLTAIGILLSISRDRRGGRQVARYGRSGLAA